LGAVGSLRAAELLLGRFNVIMMGLNMMAVPRPSGCCVVRCAGRTVLLSLRVLR
jgi:hypothetical protein